MAWWMPPSSRPGTGRSRATVAPIASTTASYRSRSWSPVSSAPTSTPGAEDGALAAHLLEPPVEVLLLHLELGDAVAQQPADLVGALVDRDRVAGPGQLLGGGQAGRAGADHRDGAAREPLRRLRPDQAGLPRLVDDRDLDVLDRDRVLVDAEHAGGLARRRAQPTGELREVVGRVQPLDRALPVVAPDQVVPLRDDVPERAALVAERDAAVHAAAGLLGDDRQQGPPGSAGVDLVPVLDPLVDRAAGRRPRGRS